jgi:LytS/YehU family sensor histidine kinase
MTILLACFPLAFIINGFFPNNPFLANNIWQPFFFIANSLYILLTVSFTSFIYLFTEWYRKERANKELERIHIQNELKYLKSQVNPHFLFNSLNNLYSMTLTGSPHAPDMVLRLSGILRYLLYETSEMKVPLEKEINYLRDLVELEKIRVGDRSKIDFDIIGDISGVEIEPLLFINFVENSFKHGVNSAHEFSWMKMELRVDKAQQILSFTIENSKPVENLSHKNDTIGGIGLNNVRKRLNLLYPNKHSLKINDNTDTYSVNLKLDLS